MMKADSNFFKHADRGKMGRATSIEFNPLLSELFICVSIMGLRHLGESLSNDEIAFVTWITCNRPYYLNSLGKENVEKSIPVKALAQIQNMPKLEFLKQLRKISL